ncbi:BTB/POZ domain-containing adapter for CUL3-mediated RhoA degradation protein 1-like [Brevipalpus obovatus]|uniref:BTB/POZ domain-containing adapter for CUL3-mediated RhoA degradation protein 1-like n=1 Tax=Brevipalpus obovatus TaxID=246614 RepID=UPI003D9EDE46
MTGLCLRTNPDREYSGESCVNLFKNLQLFERLCIDFAQKIMLLKDIKTGDDCKWCVIENGECTRIISCDEDKQIQYKKEDVYHELARICVDRLD